jgi:hypothetical protein
MKELRRRLFIFLENIKYIFKLKFNKIKNELIKILNIA